jgi:hypothetical protein
MVFRHLIRGGTIRPPRCGILDQFSLTTFADLLAFGPGRLHCRTSVIFVRHTRAIRDELHGRRERQMDAEVQTAASLNEPVASRAQWQRVWPVIVLMFAGVLTITWATFLVWLPLHWLDPL